MMTSDWSYEALYSKANIYMERALEADRNSALFPFWASLALELIGRATLAKIHPALIADPREGNYILHAFGYGSSKELPKTIGAKTIFLRLQIIIPEFTFLDEKFCLSFINMRNEELHTGTPIFEGYSTNAWLTKFYSAVKILLEFQHKNLADLLGKSEATIAEHMITEYKEEFVGKVNENIKKFRDTFNSMESSIQVDRKEGRDKLALNFIRSEKLFERTKSVSCPACSNIALLIGRFISQSEPKIFSDRVVVNINLLPIELKCFCCDLNISGNGELTVADLGGQFAYEESFDPEDYYQIETDPIKLLKDRGYTIEDLENELGYGDYGND